jgi:hypothetical protein
MTQETERGTLFVMLPFSLLSCGLSHGAIVLYAHLLRYAGGKDTCWPSVTTLRRDMAEADTEAGRMSIYRWTKELEDHKLIAVSHMKGAGNTYHILGRYHSAHGHAEPVIAESALHKDVPPAVHVEDTRHNHVPPAVHGERALHKDVPLAVHPPRPQGGRCTTGDTSHVPPAVHGSIYSEEDRKMIDGAAPQTTTPLTSTTQGDRLSVQAVTICGILGLVETDGQVAAVRRIVEAVGAEAQNGTIDPVGEARKLRERSESPTLNAYRGWLNKALTFARERSRPAAQPMVPIAVRPLSAEITQIEGREARLRRQYPKWSPEADRAWVMKKDKQAGERPPWLT